ncbi:MAG: cadmium-translocating P-type ATPase [Lachnospiraceae bacterium]|nr:cadmium-translocating P-type ATPase [Lachnospiraceae bacterium]
MNKKQKKNLIRIIISAVLLIAFHFIPKAVLPEKSIVRFIIYLIPYLVVGYDVLIKAFKGIKNKQAFDEYLLMAIATIGAMALGLFKTGDYVEAVAVMLFYQIGEWFQSYAVGKSRRNISDLMDIRPDYANIENEDGSLEQVDPDEVEVGSIIVVQPGEKIPIDGIIVDGNATLNTAALTGESKPRDVEKGDSVISGCINTNGLLKIETTTDFDESTASKILDLVENASSRKSKSEAFISRFARIYTPVVVYLAIALATIPPIVRLIIGMDAIWGEWIYRALTFLVISCPCALVISIPLSFFAGIGGASREGVLVKGSNYLEQLSKVKTVVFDKTGTLTKGVFEVTAIHPEEMDEKELLHIAAHAERYSNHPIADSLKEAYENENDGCEVKDVEEMAGHGVKAVVDGQIIYAGNSKLMDKIGVKCKPCEHKGTIIHVARATESGVKYEGHIVISDVEKATSKGAIRALKKCGIKETIMLTGDNEEIAKKVAMDLNIDSYYSGLLPEDKVNKVEELIDENGKKLLAFVGDGINDAPVISRADVGIAMGAMGSDAAIEAADIVLMDDDPMKIAKAIKISKKCIGIVNENIWFAIGIKVACLILGAVGIANMWYAIFADVGVMILAVLNAIRALFVKDKTT